MPLVAQLLLHKAVFQLNLQLVVAGGDNFGQFFVRGLVLEQVFALVLRTCLQEFDSAHSIFGYEDQSVVIEGQFAVHEVRLDTWSLHQVVFESLQVLEFLEKPLMLAVIDYRSLLL